MFPLLVLVSLLFVWTLVSERLVRWSITAPIAFALAGIVLTRGDSPAVPIDLEAHPHLFQRSVELVLAVMLFTDATEARDYERLGKSVGEGRLLGLALPASVALTTLFGAALFPGRSWWLLGVAALVVMPMDLAPVSTFLRDARVPLRVRAALNIEGGFNDGLASPLFVFCVSYLLSSDGDTFTGLLLNVLKGAALAVLVGAGLGLGAAYLVRRALDAGWARPAGLRLATLAVPFMTYALSLLVGGNGFVAAFVAGWCYATTAHAVGHHNLELAHDAVEVMALAVWFLFGKLTADEFTADGLTWQVIGYALLALTVARMLPVYVSLSGLGFSTAERSAVGWLGSRGVTSIVFAFLAYAQLPSGDAVFIFNVTCATVLLSIILHGVTMEPIARWFQRHPQPDAPG
ncbi:cation:proton antiporter [Streptomyces sp. NPDC059002]|uniref:cation:proton antiporter n=1 Tax=Streptomyces sp. NPDC059002 TaxID=3346690 RepID=UPI0036939E39